MANIQLGLAIGAGAGGVLFDAGGSWLLFLGSALMLLIASIIIKTAIPSERVMTDKYRNTAINVG